MHKKIVVIDYGVGNNQSVINALQKLGYDFLISNKKEDIENADAFIMPGVGAFSEAMKNINGLGILEALTEQVLVKKKPILGICLGMQILAEQSEEHGMHKGLGWIKGEIKKLDSTKNIRVPHVGWNDVRVFKKTPLFFKNPEKADFYFDHSYQFICDEEFIAATCSYGDDVVAAVQKENIFGVQFHPEKSQANGLKLFRSFFDYLNLQHA